MNTLNNKAANFLEARRAVKKTLLLCAFLFCILAMPVQSQTAITCGSANTLAAGTYILTADCDNTATTITVNSVEATINGNGYSISGATGNPVITITSAATLNLNNITISGSSTADGRVVQMHGGSTLNARNVVFSGNAGVPLQVTAASATATLTNVQFVNNGPGTVNNRLGSALLVWGDPATTIVTINGATFIGNSGRPQVIRVNRGILNLNGCIRVSGNLNAAGEAALLTATEAGGTVNDNRDDSLCPRPKKKKEAAPTPTATPRPQAVTCPALSQVTGIVVHATHGLTSGVQCQRLDGGGIGIQALADSYIAAVDIWGWVDQGVEVCFPQAGNLLFLDARMMPRAVAPLASTVVNGMTCGAIETPGSIVLMPPG